MKRSGKWGIVVGVVLAAAIIAGVVDAIDARERRTIITGPQVVEHWYSWGTAHDPNCQPLGRPKLPEDYTGYWEARYENGQLAIQRRYENGERHGLQRTWYQDGRLRTRVRYVHGNPEGLSTGWDVRGRKEWELPFRDGTREGKSIRWESDGTKVEEVEYVNGRRRKCTEWYESGRIRSVAHYRREFKQGKYTEWHENGKLSKVVYYEFGAARGDGTHTGWYPSGVKAWEETYEGERLHGRVRRWNEAGQLILDGVYRTGEKWSGSFVDWDWGKTVFEIWREGVRVQAQTFEGGPPWGKASVMKKIQAASRSYAVPGPEANEE